jgi:hypothetical protein
MVERREVMQRVYHGVLTLSITALLAFVTGCASSGPSTSQAPPETPEDKPAATGAMEGEQGGGGQSGAGQGGGSAGEGSEGSSEAGRGDEGGTAGSEAGGIDEGSAGDAAGLPGGQPPAGSPATDSETAAVLDRQLGGSLEEFDQRMRQEMERLAEETTDAEREGSQGTGGGTGSGSGSSGGTAGESTPSGETDSGGARGGTEEGGDSAGSVGGSGPGGTGSDRVPADVGDGEDDDIVARQLREAAVAEDDPELREKLWDEYRRYKASLGGSSKDDR